MRVVVTNRRDGGWWWRLPVLAATWLAIAMPIIIALVVTSTLRGWTRGLPEVPDLATWREGMVDLMTVNLDGVPGLRPIETRPGQVA